MLGVRHGVLRGKQPADRRRAVSAAARQQYGQAAGREHPPQPRDGLDSSRALLRGR